MGGHQVEPSSRFGALEDSRSQVLWEVGDCVFCRRWHVEADGRQTSVLAVRPTAEHPTLASLDRLAHEYGLRDELESAWAVRPLELVREGGRTLLLLEDAGGEPLERLLGAPMEVGRFLHLAIGIVRALGKAHQRGLVHKNLKPANILVNGANAEVRLTGFGIASRLPRERQAPEPPETITGTLAYMAPEQTGRMNRSIDARSDLYALGVTLYQMVTGSLPFSAADPMEWVHCHIARKPVPPRERLETIPAPVSAIVMKLLTKAAEERYPQPVACHRVNERRDECFQPLAADPVSGLPERDQRGAHLVVIVSRRTGFRLWRLRLPAQHTDRVLAMITGQLNEFVQYRALLVAVRTAVPLTDCLDQFLSYCHAEPPCHKSLPPAF